MNVLKSANHFGGNNPVRSLACHATLHKSGCEEMSWCTISERISLFDLLKVKGCSAG